MAGITTAMLASYKRDLLNGAHCHAQTRSFTCTSTTTTAVSGITPTPATATPIYQGEAVSGTNIAANTVVARITGAGAIQLNIAPTAAITAFTVTGDTFKMALIKVGMAGTYSAASNGYSDITGNADEVTGTGYTAGGTTLTNVDPAASSPGAYTNFSPDPSWTSATFSTAGCMIYNTTQNGPNVNPGCSVHDFGGTQTVSSGTFTAVMPVANTSTAILRIT